MRNEVLVLLANSAEPLQKQFNKACELYRKSPGSNARTIGYLNMGYSSARLETVLHELQKLHGITPKEIAIHKANAQASATATASQDDSAVVTLPVASDVLTKDSGDLLSDGTPAPAELFAAAPAEVKEEIKLRDEFPFLRDPNCPDKILVLVGKKLGHYESYLEKHANLLVAFPETDEAGKIISSGSPLSKEEIFALASAAVRDFVINQEIYDELNHFKATGEILGKHPIFADEEFARKLDGQSVQQVALRKSNLINYINRATKEIEESKDEAVIQKKTERIADWNRQLSIVNDWLDKHDKK